MKEFEQYLTVKSAHKEFETYLSFLKLETIVSSETSIKPLKTCISLEADALINSDTVRDKTEFNSEHDLSLCPCGSLKLQSNLKADYLSLSLDLHVGYCTDCSALMDSCIVTFFEVLGEALQRRVFNLPRTISGYEEIEDRTDQLRLEYDKINNGTATSKRLIDSKVGILFSGGIDSMVIAALADR